MKKMLAIFWLCTSLTVYSQQNDFDIMDYAQSRESLLSLQKNVEQRCTDLRGLQQKALSLVQESVKVNNKFFGDHQGRFAQFIIHPDLQDYYILQAMQSRQSEIEKFVILQNIIQKKLDVLEVFSHEPRDENSIASESLTGQTTHASDARSDRSFSISTSTSNVISSTSSIASDDCDESVSPKTLNSILVKNNVDAKIKVQRAYALSLRSQRVYDAESEIAKKKKETQLLQQKVAQEYLVGLAHKAKKTVQQQNESQQYLKNIATKAIVAEQDHQEKQKRVQQCLQDKERNVLRQQKNKAEMAAAAEITAARKEAQRQKSLLKLQNKKEQEQEAQRKQDEDNKFLERCRAQNIVKSSDFNQSMYTMLDEIVNENGDIADNKRNPIGVVEDALYENIKQNMRAFDINEEDVIKKGIIQPAIILSTVTSIDLNVANQRWLDFFTGNGLQVTKEQINHCKDIFGVIFTQALKVRVEIREYSAKSEVVRRNIDEYHKNEKHT